MDSLTIRQDLDCSLSARERARLLRRHALHCKYASAVELYADTDMALGRIAEECGVSVGGLGQYLRRYWRELVLRRNGMSAGEGDAHGVKIIQAGRQNALAHEKYKNAVAACDSLEYIDLNVSQVARKYGLAPTALANFMRVHYPDTLTRREEARRKLGINDNLWHGARPECVKQYAEAVELYRSTDMTVPEIADKCEVSESGLSQHLRFYHKDVLERKRLERKSAKEAGEKEFGRLLGNGRKYRPSAETEKKYAEALKLYKDTALTVKDIVRQTGVTAEGFRAYLHKWHRDLVLERLGISGDVGENADLRGERRRVKTTAAKYAEAIDSLKRKPRPVAKVAAEFGFNPEVFRAYLRKHEPELALRHGRARMGNGRSVSRAGMEKYSEAVRLYATTKESMRSIAARLGLVYKTVDNFVRRNCPDVTARHNELLRQAGDI